MIKFDDKTISSVYAGEKVIEKIYKGTLKVYEGWRNLFVSGVPPLTLLNCKGVDLIDYKLYGNSAQQLKNLFDYETLYADTTKFDITDGVLSGVARNINTIKYYIPQELLGKQLIFSADLKQGGETNGVYLLATINGARIYGNVVKSEEFEKATVTFTPTSTNDTIQITYGTGGTGTIYARNIQLEIGDTVTEYEPFKTPTPTTPIEVKCVGDKTRNLLTFTDKKTSNSGVSLQVANNTFTINGTATATSLLVFISYNSIKDIVLPAGTYTVSVKGVGTVTNNGKFLQIYTVDTEPNTLGWIDVIGLNVSKTFTLTETKKIRLRVIINNGISYDATFNLQLAEGTTTDYEPYGYKIPVRVSGKNLIDVTDITKEAEGKTVVLYRFDKFNKKPGIYTFSCEIEVTKNTGNKYALNYGYTVEGGSVTYGVFSSFNDDTEHINEKGYRYSFNFVANNTLTFFYVFINSSTTNGQVTLKNAMLTVNNTDLTYEPYVGEPITTNIYLDQPLRKTDNVVDYIDFKNQVLKSQIKEVVFNGSEKWALNTRLEGVNRFYLTLTDSYPTNSGAIYNQCKCSHFDTTSNMSIGNRDFLKNLVYVYNNIAYFYTNPNEFPDLEYWIEWVKNNKLTLQYKSAEESTTKIELPNISTFKGTTIIEVDTEIQPSNMEVKYKGKNKGGI